MHVVIRDGQTEVPQVIARIEADRVLRGGQRSFQRFALAGLRVPTVPADLGVDV